MTEAIYFEKSQNVSLKLKRTKIINAIISITKSEKTYSLSYKRYLKFCPVSAARQLGNLSEKRPRRSRRVGGAHLNRPIPSRPIIV